MSLKITEEEYKQRLDEAIMCLEKYLNITKYYRDDELKKYYEKIDKYMRTRIGTKSFSNNLIEKVVLLKELGYGEEDISKAIYNFPSLLHMDKKETLIKYLLFGKIVNNKGGNDRDNIMINHTKDLMISKEMLYARIMFFLIFEESNVRKREITRRKALKITNSEFKMSYEIDRETLLKYFPFNEEAFKLICNWQENVDIVKSLVENGLELK